MLCLEKNNYCQRYNKEGRIIICCCIQGPKELFRPFKMRPRCNRRQEGKVQIIAELVDLCHFTWNSEKQRWEHWARKMPGTLPGVARGQVKLSGAALQHPALPFQREQGSRTMCQRLHAMSCPRGGFGSMRRNPTQPWPPAAWGARNAVLTARALRSGTEGTHACQGILQLPSRVASSSAALQLCVVLLGRKLQVPAKVH